MKSNQLSGIPNVPLAFFNRFIATLTLFVILGLLAACNDSESEINANNDDDSNLPTIVEIVQADNNFTMLEEALLRFPDFVAQVGNAELTAFAPTDQAFQNLLTTLGKNSLSELPDQVLLDILEYHLVNGIKLSTQLTNSLLATLNGEDITVSVNSIDNTITLNTAQITGLFDVEALNGVVHAINEVLLPPSIQVLVGTVVGKAFFNPDFTTLIAALEKADLVNYLLERSTVTVFAPTNQAFINAGINLDNMSSQELASVLRYHLIGTGAIRVEAFTDNQEVLTVRKFEAYIDVVDQKTFINGIDIIETNLEASNGIVHVIEDVLIPPTEMILTAFESLKDEYSLFFAIVEGSGLGGAMHSEPLTGFIPTDEAFIEAGLTAEVIAQADYLYLGSIVRNHIVIARLFSPDLIPGSTPVIRAMSVNSSGEESEMHPLTNALNSQSALLVDTDQVVYNGVVHVINRVILP